jgi:hypothetical protein
MLHLVLAAFFGTEIAQVGARHAHRAGGFTAPCHESGGDAAKLGAIDVESDTARQHCQVLLLQAGRSTHVARIRAVITSFDT